MKMPVPMVEPRPIAVSELAVNQRFSGGARSSSATMASTERTANRRRRKSMGPRGRKRLMVGGYWLPHGAHSLQGRARYPPSASLPYHSRSMATDDSPPIPNSYWG